MFVVVPFGRHVLKNFAGTYFRGFVQNGENGGKLIPAKI